MYLNNFIYYMIFCSAVLIYGAGLNRSTVVSESPKNILLNMIKMLIVTVVSSLLTYLLVTKMMVKAGLAELYPFVSVLIFSALSIMAESLVRLSVRKNTAEYAVSLVCVFISVSESLSILECLINACSIVLSFFLIIPVLYSIRKRIEVTSPLKQFKNSSLLLISIAIIVVILFAWNVSWLNPGVFR